MIVNNKVYTKSVRLNHTQIGRIEYLKSKISKKHMIPICVITFSFIIEQALICLEEEFKKEESKNE